MTDRSEVRSSFPTAEARIASAAKDVLRAALLQLIDDSTAEVPSRLIHIAIKHLDHLIEVSELGDGDGIEPAASSCGYVAEGIAGGTR